MFTTNAKYYWMEYVTEEVYDHLSLARNLIELMREESDLSYGHSQCCVESIVSRIYKVLRIPALEPLIAQLNQDVLDVATSNDTKRLETTLEKLSSFKDEWQQRSWSLYEDQETIMSSLAELGLLMKLADKRVCLAGLARYEYKRLFDLVEFYQMETRLAVRIAVLDGMKLICLLDKQLISVLLPTILPLELARDVLSEQQPDPSRKYCLSLEILSLLFATAEALPYTHYDVLNVEFLNSLHRFVEMDTASDCPLQAAMKTIIAFNLHFTDPDSNLVIQCLSAQDSTKNFSERLLLMCNKEDASMWPFPDIQAPYPSGVVKLLQDIFSSKAIAEKLFYSNDAAVLVDIVLREIVDLNPGRLILAQSDIMDGRLSDGIDCLKQLDLTDDGSFPEEDYLLIQEIRRLLSSKI